MARWKELILPCGLQMPENFPSSDILTNGRQAITNFFHDGMSPASGKVFFRMSSMVMHTSMPFNLTPVSIWRKPIHLQRSPKHRQKRLLSFGNLSMTGRIRNGFKIEKPWPEKLSLTPYMKYTWDPGKEIMKMAAVLCHTRN